MKVQLTTLSIILMGILIGAPIGLGTFTFYYADGFSYFSDNPKSCTNCHVMNHSFASWQRSSHQGVAVCNDCHASGGLVAKYTAKATHGLAHSWAFTTGQFNEPISIKPNNLAKVEISCRNCHREFLESSHIAQTKLKTMTCMHCHQKVGHNK